MKQNIKMIVGICFISYIALLLYLTIFSRIETLHFIWEDGRLEYYFDNRFNIFPFKSIIYIFQNLNVKQVFLNIIGNMIAFAPFAFFIPYFWKKNMGPIQFLFLMILLSFSIEFTQLITLSGSFDIDDIILNVFGAFLAYYIFQIVYIKQVTREVYFDKKNNRKYQKIFLSFLFCFVVFSSLICLMIYLKTR